MYVFSDRLWLIRDCYTFWGFNDNCDWKSKIKNQNFFFWAILDLQKLFELSWNLSLIVAIQIISFCSLDYCLEWDLIIIEFEPPSISPHVMEHKKCGGNDAYVAMSYNHNFDHSDPMNWCYVCWNDELFDAENKFEICRIL